MLTPVSWDGVVATGYHGSRTHTERKCRNSQASTSQLRRPIKHNERKLDGAQLSSPPTTNHNPKSTTKNTRYTEQKRPTKKYNEKNTATMEGQQDESRKRSIDDAQASGSVDINFSGEQKAGRTSFDTNSGPHPADATATATATAVPPKVRRTSVAKGKSVRTGTSPEKPKRAAAAIEKRPKRFRAQPPRTIAERLERAKGQRMFVVSRGGEQMGAEGPSETFTVASSTGALCTVRICSVPSCDCSDGRRSGTCKHVMYVLDKVFKAPANLVYQAGLLLSELNTIFAHAVRHGTGNSGRRPLQESDCPMCFCLFDECENTVWCKAQCGTNIHETCFDQLVRIRGSQGVATCVVCRQPWKERDTEVTKALGEGTGETVHAAAVPGEIADAASVPGEIVHAASVPGETVHAASVPGEIDHDASVPGEIAHAVDAPGVIVKDEYVDVPGEIFSNGYVDAPGEFASDGYVDAPGGMVSDRYVDAPGGMVSGRYVDAPGGMVSDRYVDAPGGMVSGRYVDAPGGMASDGYVGGRDDLALGGARNCVPYTPWFVEDVQNTWGHEGYYNGY